MTNRRYELFHLAVHLLLKRLRPLPAAVVGLSALQSVHSLAIGTVFVTVMVVVLVLKPRTWVGGKSLLRPVALVVGGDGDDLVGVILEDATWIVVFIIYYAVMLL